MTFPETPADWNDVSFGVQQGYLSGWLAGHKAGHLQGWQAGLDAGALRDETFIRALADEIRRRDLDDDKDTSGIRQWISKLIDSLDAKARRDAFGQRVRQDREQRQTNPQTNWKAA